MQLASSWANKDLLLRCMSLLMTRTGLSGPSIIALREALHDGGDDSARQDRSWAPFPSRRQWRRIRLRLDARVLS